MVRYFIEFALVHSILILIYGIIIRKETQLAYMRGYLQVALFLAVSIPFLSIPNYANIPEVDISGTVTTLLLPEVIVTVSGSVSEGATYQQILIWLFVAGAGLSFLRLLLGYLRIRSIFTSSESIQLMGKRIHHKDQLKSSFTFFNRIVIDKEHFKDPEHILHHEEAHVKYGHSYDILISNLFTIPFWWLPSMWISIKEFKKVHEYQADTYALRASTPEKYISALVTNVLVNHGMELTSSFHDTKIFERLNFIKKMKKNISPVKIYSTILLVALTAFVFSCEDKMNNEIDPLVQNSQEETYSETVTNRLEELRNEFPNTTFKVIQISGDKETIQQYDFSGSKFKEAEVIGDKTIRLSIIVTEDFEISKRKESSGTLKINKEVDEWPQYSGGKNELVKFIGNNVKYPKEAAESGISGKVFVEFIIDKNGEVTNATVLRGIGSGCDEEALRVVNSMPNWTPGQKEGESVDVKMVLPITFQLN